MNAAFEGEVNGSKTYLFERADLEQPFDGIVEDLEMDVIPYLPQSIPYVVSGSALLYGFIKNVQGEEPDFNVSDTDIYATERSDYKPLVNSFTCDNHAYYESHSDRNVKFALDGGPTIDFVRFRFGDVMDIVTQHDLSPAGIGVMVDGGDAVSFCVTGEFIHTMKDGNMRLQNGFENVDVVAVARTIDRIFKYKSRGFEPTFDLINKTAKHIYSCDPGELSEHAVDIAEATTTSNESA